MVGEWEKNVYYAETRLSGTVVTKFYPDKLKFGVLKTCTHVDTEILTI